MKLKDIYSTEKSVISFEIFPPKGDQVQDKVDALFEELKILSKFKPAFISVTYGAGGSTRERTPELVFRIQNELKIRPLPHFTCVGSSRQEILEYLKLFKNKGIENVLALRGDPPQGEIEFIKPEDGFNYANELVEFIKANTNFAIAVAGYPEKHQECLTMERDIINLKRKVDFGADIIITQVFYDNKYFFDFLERTQKIGINIPIIPGILPITNISQIEKMMKMCGTKIPEKLINDLRANQDNSEIVKRIGIDHAISQCRELLKHNVSGMHFCTLNKSAATKAILENLDFS